MPTLTDQHNALFDWFVPMIVVLTLSACGGDGSNGSDGGSSADTTPPTVALNTVAANVSRTVSLAATATDDRGVARVEFLADGNVIGSDTSTPFSFDWNTGNVSDGSHSVSARAVDAAGNTTTTTAVTVVVKNNFTYGVVLSGSQEIPAVTTLAAGDASLNVNIGTGAVSGTLVLTGITATAAHVHDGFAGQNGPVAVGLTESTSTPGTWEFAPSAALTAAQVQKLLAGGLYLNAHSAAFPGGEIRGQIVPSNITVGFATLEGLQEVPGVTTDGSAQGAVTINRDTGLATIHLTARGVVDPTAAHLHDGAGGRNGPVVISLTQDGSAPSHWSATDQPVSAAILASFDAGATYLNMHTSAHPGGEVRGQVTPPDVLFVANRLSGAQEVPAKTTAGQGTVALTVDRTTRGFVLHANVTGVDDSTAAHIHEAYAGVNGAVAVPLTKDATDPTHWSATGGTFTEAQFAALEKGRFYVNVHTPANPGGEIRGQLVPPGVRLVFAPMSGDQEVPAVVTSASGIAATTVDLAARTASIHVRATGVDDATAAHFHKAPRGTSGPVIVPLTQEAGTPGHWLAEEQTVSDAQVNDFLAGLWYANVHTPAHPDGEIRGQIEIEQLPAADTTAPAITLAALPATVSGTVALTATAQDNVGVTSVRFLVNGTEIGTDTTAPYSFDWNTTTVANGQAMVGAEARDAAGNVGQAAVLTVTVNNAVAATTLSQLQATIFTPRCSGCHTGGGGSLPSSMNLSSAAASFAALVNVASVEQPTVLRVKPNDDGASYLVRKLEGDASISGVRMPQGGPFLSTADMDKVKSWINAGAINN